MKSPLRSSTPTRRPLLGLEDRIRQVRRGIRAKQALQTRIDLVRERHAAATRAAELAANHGDSKGVPPQRTKARA